MDCLGSPTTKSFPSCGVMSAQSLGLSASVVFGGTCLGEEHCNLSLDEVGVLRLVYEQMGEPAAEVVAGVEVVAQHVSRPDKQVLEARASLCLTAAGVVEDE